MLSIAMIVKDEEDCLGKCLDSIVPIANELSIVDTGSTDDTIGIINRFAQKVNFPVILNHHKWEDGYFSGNRNYGLQFCTQGWILWIDADEWIYPECYTEIEKIVRRGDIYTCFCGLLSDLPDGRISKHYLPKMFRRNTAHFEGIVHNQVNHSSPVLITGVKIHHTGYATTPEKMQKKRKRTSGLLRKQITEKQENPFAYMNLSRTLMNDQKYEESIVEAEKGLQYKSSDACVQMLLYSRAVCAIQLKDFDKAEESCWWALRLNPWNLDMTFMLANAAVNQKSWEKAIVYLNRYLQLKVEDENKPPQQQLNFLITDFYEARDKAYNMLGFCYNQIGDKVKASEMYQKAVQYSTGNSQHGMMLRNLAMSYEETGNLDFAQQIWYHLVEQGYIDEMILKKVTKNES